MKTVNILVIDDCDVFVTGFELLLKQKKRNDIHLVGKALNRKKAIELCNDNEVDIVLLDRKLGGLDYQSDLEFIREFRETFSKLKLIVYSYHMPAGFVDFFKQIGVEAFLPKDQFSKQILSIIDKVSAGDKVFDDKLLQQHLNHYYDSNLLNKVNELTETEEKVAHWLSMGLSLTQIAEKQKAKENTISNHRTHIYKKLSVNSLGELIATYGDYLKFTTVGDMC